MEKFIEIECAVCGVKFERIARFARSDLKKYPNKKSFCSKECLSISRNKQAVIKCTQCQIEFKKPIVKMTEHNFCSHKCSATFTNIERSKNGFSQAGKKKPANCITCSKPIEIGFSAVENKAKCSDCKEIAASAPKLTECKNCGEEKLINKYGKYCAICLVEVQQKAGIKSAESQRRRSKNEILFADMCKEKFVDVRTNECLFAGWDSDVALPDLKIAVMWNGIFHYKQIARMNNLKQVQARDKIKGHAIRNSGYTLYIIKDMGKYDPIFVKEEFDKFVLFVEHLPIDPEDHKP